MKTNNKADQKQSFIAEARRAQIITAAITTLDEIGYVQASLAQIAKRAGISTALISYHFADREDLMNQVLVHLLETSTSYILERTAQHEDPVEKLNAFIVASLAYQGTHRAHNVALLEIIFNARTADNIPYYKMEDDEEEPLPAELQQILRDGQQRGIFKEFNIPVMSSMIQGAIGEYMLSTGVSKHVDLETYSTELVKIVSQATRREPM
jgi:TetR/AcrR family transcriptional repressor of bet genes